MKGHTATRAVTWRRSRARVPAQGDLLLIAQADEEDGIEAVGMRWLVNERPDLAPDYAIDEGGGERLALVDGRTSYRRRRREGDLPVWSRRSARPVTRRRRTSRPTRSRGSPR